MTCDGEAKQSPGPPDDARQHARRSAVSVGPVARLDQGQEPGRAGSDAGDRMNADELYTALSERITADAMGHETNKWPDYYNGLRDLIRRVVTESTESGLSADEKDALIERLLKYVSALEEWWPPKLNPSR